MYMVVIDGQFFVTEDDIVASKSAPGSQGTVLPYVAISCLGAILFGYHLGYVFF